MSRPHPNWFHAEVCELADRFGLAAKEAREAMRAPVELADADVCLNDAGTELVVQGDVAGFPVMASMSWAFDGLNEETAMLIRGSCESRANAREAGCRLIRIIPHTNERSVAA